MRWRYVVEEALNERALTFYLHNGLAPVEGRPDRFVIRIKDLTQH